MKTHGRWSGYFRHGHALLMILVVVGSGSGCGGVSRTATRAGAPRQESSAEARWRHQAEQFAHDLSSGLEALASTASTDAYQAVANLGPLTYCSQNLAELGPPPPVYQLAYGSLTAACDQFETGAEYWRDEVNSNGGAFGAAVGEIRLGRRFLDRGMGRLERFRNVEPALSGRAAARAERWASPILIGWASGRADSIQDVMAQFDTALRSGSADPGADLWAEHAGGIALTITDCGDILDRYVKGSPPDEPAQRTLSALHDACQALASAADDGQGHRFDKTAFRRAEIQMRRALSQLDAIAP